MPVRQISRPGPVQGSVRGETRAEILRHAEQVFAQEGFSGASLDMIAVAVGIRRPSVLHHFASKREIYDQIESDIFAELGDKVEEQIAGVDDLFERLMALLEAWLDFMTNRPAAARIVLRNASDLVSRSHDPVEFANRVVTQFEAIVLEGQAAGIFRAVRPMMVLNILGTGILASVCNAEQLGKSRRYRADDEGVKNELRLLLRQSARAMLLP